MRAYVLDAAKTQHKNRLAGIDAPERVQPFGRKSKEHLAELVAGRPKAVDWNKRDRLGRVVGKIILNDTDVNLSMVRAGYVWWYRKYADEQSPADQNPYDEAEDKARAGRLGLWRDPNPVPPWDWRRR